MKSEWLLDQRVTFLNHGSFGAVPRCVFDEQTQWRLRLEAEPIELLARRGTELLGQTKQAVGAWLGMRPADFGLVTNATEGINAILRSLILKPGDEVLTTTHVYHAVRQSMKHVAERAGAQYREIEIPLPIESADELLDRIAAGLSPRTRLLIVDHITSPTALVFPVERIAEACAARGIDLLVDGAHAPGMVPLAVPGIGAAYYAGNLHKWACAPKGTAFLWVRPDRQSGVHPLVISHHLGEGFAREFDWQGTRDLSSWLSVPRALGFMSDLGWDAIRTYNHALATWVQRLLCEAWGVEGTSPADGSMLGSMASVLLPTSLQALPDEQIQSLQRRLYSEHRIEVPLMRWGGRVLVRPCSQVYNTPAEYERLSEIISMISQVGLPA